LDETKGLEMGSKWVVKKALMSAGMWASRWGREMALKMAGAWGTPRVQNLESSSARDLAPKKVSPWGSVTGHRRAAS